MITVTPEQIKFFQKLLEEKDFGGRNLDELAEQFAKLDKKSASLWIERALALPKRDDSNDPVIQPSF